MLAFIQGKIESKNEKSVLVKTDGFGFQIFCSKKTLEEIKIGQEIKFFTYLCLKKETIEIYGFLALKELELFELLNNISGIGAKTALNLTSFGSLEKLKEMIEKQEFLPELKGIGKKKIQKIILEITGRISDLKKEQPSFEEDPAFEALIALGFSAQKTKEALSQLPQEIKETEEKIKQSLKILQKR